MAEEVSISDIRKHLIRHFYEYIELECRVRELEHTVYVLWGELVDRTGEMNLKNDWYGLDKRLRMLEEGEDGRNKYLSSTLKEIETNANKRRKHSLELNNKEGEEGRGNTIVTNL